MGLQKSVSSKTKLALILRDNGLTYAAIGRKLKVSREFARQMVNGTSVGLRKKPIPFDDADAFLTTGQAARLLNIHVNTVRRWADCGVIKTYRLGSRGDRRYMIRDVRQLLQLKPAIVPK